MQEARGESHRLELERLRRVVEVSRLLHGTLELDAILERILELASSLLASERSTLFLIDEAKQEFRSRSIQESAEIRMPVSAGIAGHVASTGRPFYTNEPYSVPFFNREVDLAGNYRTRSLLCVPLRDRRGRVIGALETLNRREGQFDEGDVTFLEDLSTQAAIAIENSLLHESLMRDSLLRKELGIAAGIQKSLLRPGASDLAGVSLRAFTQPARDVGGDFYDYMPTPRGTLLVAVGDVSGKGVGAALLMTNVLASIQILSSLETGPGPMMERLNRFFASRQSESFCTVFLAELHPVTRALAYCNAGHPPAWLFRAGGGREELGDGGFPLGVDERASYDEGAVTLGAGDLLFAYTDGLPEARDRERRLFGTERLSALVDTLRTRAAAAVVDAVRAELEEFSREAPQADDQTALAIRAV